MSVRRRILLPWVVLAIGLIATAIVAGLVMRSDSARQRARFDALADAVVGAIEGRLNEQRVLLRGVTGLFLASQEVGGDEFRRYVAQLRLPENHPGVLGVGFSLLAHDQSELDRAVALLHADGVRDFAPWPARSGFPVSTIMFLEPRSHANRQAIGFDMFGEPVRREAMLRALRSGEAALSSKVRLVQDQGLGDAAGFLLYLPLRQENIARDGAVAHHLTGWAYSPIRARELFGSALARGDLADAAVAVYDGPARTENLLFRGAETARPDSLRTQRRLNFAGRSWTITVAALPGFAAKSSLPLGIAVAAGGILVSLLLAALAFQQARATIRTEEEVARATEDLRRANDEILQAANAREEAENQVRQMQKMEAVGQLTGGIAHDFNNMLAIVIGNLDLAERRVSDPDRVKRSIDMAREGARRAADLTQRLLAFGRRQALRPRTIDINRLVLGMNGLLRRALGETIEQQTELAADLWPVEADPGQVENSLLNLVINARDAMPDGGSVTIKTANCCLGEDFTPTDDAANGRQYVLIAVSDTGCGMSTDVAARALEPFFTTKEVGRGTGLGLSQVFGFVKQSGGHLDISSAVDMGTTIRIYLPRANEAAAPVETPVREAALPAGRSEEVIVVAEDEEDVRAVTVETLREHGYAVREARNGLEALAALEQCGGAALLFTDIVMPGMDGRALAAKARTLYPDLPILFTTGYARDAIGPDGRLEAGIELIAKPFHAADMLQKVRAMLDAG